MIGFIFFQFFIRYFLHSNAILKVPYPLPQHFSPGFIIYFERSYFLFMCLLRPEKDISSLRERATG